MTLPPGELTGLVYTIWIHIPEPWIYTVFRKKDLQSSVNNFNKFKRIFTIFGTHYPDDTFYEKHVKFAFKIYLSLCGDIDVIMTRYIRNQAAI